MPRLHRTALFQTARRMERKPGLRGDETVPPTLASKMGEGISGRFKTEPDGGGRGTLSHMFPKEAIPREGTWSQHLPGDRTKVLRSLLGNESPSECW